MAGFFDCFYNQWLFPQVKRKLDLDSDHQYVSTTRPSVGQATPSTPAPPRGTHKLWRFYLFIYLFIYLKEGTVHNHEHSHVNMPECSKRLVSICSFLTG